MKTSVGTVYFWTSIRFAVEDADTDRMTRREDGIMRAFAVFPGLVLVSAGCSSGNTTREAPPDARTGSMTYVIPASMSRIGTIDERTNPAVE